MSYYKQIDENGNLICILAYNYQPEIDDPLCIKISRDEYFEILKRIYDENGESA